VLVDDLAAECAVAVEVNYGISALFGRLKKLFLVL